MTSTTSKRGSGKRKGDLVTAWTALVFGKKHTFDDGASFQSWSTLTIFNCKNKTTADKRIIIYSGRSLNGNILLNETFPDNSLRWKDTVRGGPGRALLDAICNP